MLHVRPQFSPSTPILADAPGYRQKVTLNDKIHCVVYVVDASQVSILTQKMIDKFAAIRKKTNQLGEEYNNVILANFYYVLF